MSSAPARRIEHFVTAGLLRTIAQQLNTQISLTLREDYSDSYRRLYKDQTAIRKARGFLRLKSLGKTDAQSGPSYRADVLARQGVRSRGHARSTGVDPNQVQTHAQIVNVIPVTIRYEFAYVTNDLDELLDFFSRWHFAQERCRLDFKLDYLGQVYPIQIHLDQELSVPERALKGEGSDLSEFVGEVTAYGYLSSNDPRDVYEMPVINTTDLTIDFLTAGG